jgi:hypothetical protein
MKTFHSGPPAIAAFWLLSTVHASMALQVEVVTQRRAGKGRADPLLAVMERFS